MDWASRCCIASTATILSTASWSAAPAIPIISSSPISAATPSGALLVLYLPEAADYRAALARMAAAGFAPVKSYNPYWDEGGATFEDPDYRVVLTNRRWA